MRDGQAISNKGTTSGSPSDVGSSESISIASLDEWIREKVRIVRDSITKLLTPFGKHEDLLLQIKDEVRFSGESANLGSGWSAEGLCGLFKKKMEVVAAREAVPLEEEGKAYQV